MTQLSKGANTSVSTGPVRAVLSWQPGGGSLDIDVSALLVTSAGKVRSDQDFVFYNQAQHGSGAVLHAGKQGTADTITVDLGRVEDEIEKVVLAASADGGTFGQAQGLQLQLLDATGLPVAVFAITDASSETAMVAGELYRRQGGWKFRAVGQGYDTGLAGLATDFGISVDDSPAPAAAPVAQAAPSAPTFGQAAPPSAPAFGQSAPPSAPQFGQPQAPAAPQAPQQGGGGVSLKKQKLISMEKELETKAPGLLSLTKKAAVSLEKRGLGEHTARVALCLDISGSMYNLYRSGKMQALVERVLAVGVRFDDDGQVDCFLFGEKAHQPPAIGIDNFHSYVADVQGTYGLEGATYYGRVMQMIRQHYFGTSGPRSAPYRDQTPVYVMFVTDGQTMDQPVTRDQVIASSYEPLFWQFMAIGDSPRAVDAAKPAGGGGFLSRMTGGGRAAAGSDARASQFQFLEELDDMGGRYLDNADFFAVQDPANISDEQLFDLMSTEYPTWLQQAAQRGLL